ncbi:MAG TPA: hypothetical protein VGL62_02040 [Vicinamibacterales bacterium]|jgi:hypothetical protein
MSAEGILPPAGPPARRGALIALAIVAFTVAIVAFGAGWLLGGRHLLYSVPSPSGDATALVMESGCVEGPCESLWIGPNERAAKRVEVLVEDSETCDDIAWTSDGARVGFLVNGYQLRVFDAHTGANLGAVNLFEPDGYPSSRIARGVTFSSNGAAVTFDDCPRDHSGCRPAMLALKLR